MLTRERLKELFKYNPISGYFIRLVARGGRKIGEIAGSKTAGGYIQIRIDGVDYKASRLAFLYMTGNFPEELIDHKNRICWDNRWDNLRIATVRDNQHNRKDNNKCVGVTWDSRTEKWRSYGSCNKIQQDIGRYVEWWDGVCARKSWEAQNNIKIFSE